MHVHRITPNMRVADIHAARSLYSNFLGLGVEQFNLGWVARYTDPASGAHVQLVTSDVTAAEDSVISVHSSGAEGTTECW